MSAQAHTDLGFALTREDDWEGAIEKYKAAIKADRTYARAYANLGFALNKQGRNDEAITACTEGLAVAHATQEQHRLYDARGFARSRSKDYKGAIEDFSAAIKLSPNNPKAFLHRAESYALMGEYKLAYQDAGYALRLDGDFTPAYRLIQRLESQGLA